MTITMAIMDKQVVYMATDSASTDENNELVIRKGSSKMWTTFIPGFGTVLIGFSGVFAVGMWLRYSFRWPKCTESFESYLVRIIQPKIKAGLYKRFKNQDAWDLLLAVPENIYHLTPCGDVEQNTSQFAAIGDAASIALGSLHSLQEAQLYPDEKLELAFQACQQYRTSVRGPLHIQYLTA